MNASIGGNAASPALTDFIILNEEIAALVRARMPLEAHLSLIGAELPGKAGELTERIGRRLATGESLSQAMEVECGSMPAAYRTTILAGVESGQLGTAVESLVDTAARMDQLRRITGVSLIYPIAILVVTCLLLAMVIIQVIPQFAWLDQSHFGPIAWLSRWPRSVLAFAVVAPCLVILALTIWWWRSGRVGGVFAARFRLLAWLPGARAVHRWSQAATFSELLLLLVERGLALDHALRLSAEAIDDARLRTAAKQVAERIQCGGNTRSSDSNKNFHDVSEFPLLIRLALHHSSDRALLAGSLRQAAVVYRDRAIRAADWYAEYAPILLTVGIGGTLTICYTLLILWPYASMLRELAR
jgi:general secretion pathway protein F